MWHLGRGQRAGACAVLAILCRPKKRGVIGIALTWIKVAVLACVRDRREYGSYVEHVATLHLLYVCIGVRVLMGGPGLKRIRHP